MRKLTIEFVSPACVEFTGWNVRDLYAKLYGRPPVWNSRSRRFTTQPGMIDDLVAVAGLKGYSIELIGEPPRRSRDVTPVTSRVTPEPETGLW